MVKKLFRNIITLFEQKKLKITSFKERAEFYLSRFAIFNFLFELKKKSNESILIFGLLILWGNVCFIITRGFGIWYFELWDQFNIYLFTVIFGCLVSTLIIFAKYLQINNYFVRFKENKKRLKMYENYLINKRKVEANIWFKRTGRVWLILTCLSYSLFFYAELELALYLLIISSLFLFAYFINAIYLSWLCFKNPMPEYLLLEPPKAISFLFCKVLKREYSSTSKAWSAARTQGVPIIMGIGTATAGLIGADIAMATHNGETTYLQRLDDQTSKGWHTTDPKIRSQMSVLQEAGQNPAMYTDNGTTRLNSGRVRQAYYRYKYNLSQKDSVD